MEEFARTFAPDERRLRFRRGNRVRRRQFLWLAAGLTFVVAGIVLLLSAWLASRRALPATGPFAMRTTPGASVAALRDRNHTAAPLVALAALPLLSAGGWLLAKRPPNAMTRSVLIVATIAFFLVGLAADAASH